MPNRLKLGRFTVPLGPFKLTPDMTAHIPGINEGNSKGNYEKMGGHNPDGTSTAERSTGINPKAQEPIDPSMPNLSPG